MPDRPPPRFELEEFHRDISNDDLIADLLRVSRLLGKLNITFRDYNASGRFSSSTIAVRFGSWHRALEKAGLKKSINRDISKEDLFRNLADLWTKLGRQPKTRDLSPDMSAYSAATYANRFGAWRNALGEFINWANEGEAQPPDQGVVLAGRRSPRDPSLRLRFFVLKRDGLRCRACGASPAIAPGLQLHVDHVVPWSVGGMTLADNLQTLCEPCNLGKSNVA